MHRSRSFLTIPEVARLLGRTSARAYQMARAGQLPATEVGGRLVIPVAAWEAWMRGRTEAALAALRVKADAPTPGARR
jgi:excisionase family DNA binding protein